MCRRLRARRRREAASGTEQLTIEPGKKYFINVGSVGQPRDGDWRAAYCIYDTERNVVEQRRVKYDCRDRAEENHPGRPARDSLADRLSSVVICLISPRIPWARRLTMNITASILIIKPSSLGDMVHTLPAVAAIREANPDARNHLGHQSGMGHRFCAAIRDINHVHIFPRGELRGLDAPRPFAALVEKNADSCNPISRSIFKDFCAARSSGESAAHVSSSE